jgi:hypothetical protein
MHEIIVIKDDKMVKAGSHRGASCMVLEDQHPRDPRASALTNPLGRAICERDFVLR